MLTAVEVANYKEARDNHLGFCPKCQEWTRDGVEPDAYDYHECPQCGGHRVIGAGDYLLYMGTLAAIRRNGWTGVSSLEELACFIRIARANGYDICTLGTPPTFGGARPATRVVTVLSWDASRALLPDGTILDRGTL